MKWILLVIMMSFPNLIYAEKALNESFFRHPDVFEEAYSNLLQFKAGVFQPQSIVIENTKYKYLFNADTLNTYLFEGSWDKRLFSFLGQWGLKAQVGYAQVRANYYLHIIPVGLSLSYGLQLWNRQWIIPVVEGGGNYYFYIQNGDTDGAYADGAVFQPHWAVGIRLAFHHILGSLFSVDSDTPYFFEAHYKEIMGSNRSVSFSQKSYFAGFSIGI